MRDVQTSDIEPITPQIEVCTCLHWPENLVKNEIFTQSPSGADGPQRRLFSSASVRACGPPLTGSVRPTKGAVVA